MGTGLPCFRAYPQNLATVTDVLYQKSEEKASVFPVFVNYIFFREILATSRKVVNLQDVQYTKCIISRDYTKKQAVLGPTREKEEFLRDVLSPFIPRSSP